MVKKKKNELHLHVCDSPQQNRGFSGVKDGVIWLRGQTNELFRNLTGASKFDHRGAQAPGVPLDPHLIWS